MYIIQRREAKEREGRSLFEIMLAEGKIVHARKEWEKHCISLTVHSKQMFLMVKLPALLPLSYT